MDTSPTRHVRSARRGHVCDWCYERIEPGTPYSTWFAYGDNVTVRLLVRIGVAHRECEMAFQAGTEL